MFVTLPVFQLEMSWSNDVFDANTVKMNGLGKEFVSIQQFIFCWWRFFKLKKTKKKNEKIIGKQKDIYIWIKNNKKREWVKREKLRTPRHGRDAARVPIGDVTVKTFLICKSVSHVRHLWCIPFTHYTKNSSKYWTRSINWCFR